MSRFLPVLHALNPLTVGLSTMRYREFLARTVPTCIVWVHCLGALPGPLPPSRLAVSVGWLAAGSIRQLLAQLHFAGYLSTGIIAGFLVIVVPVKKAVTRAEDRHIRHSDVPLGGADNEPAHRNATDRNALTTINVNENRAPGR